MRINLGRVRSDAAFNKGNLCLVLVQVKVNGIKTECTLRERILHRCDLTIKLSHETFGKSEF